MGPYIHKVNYYETDKMGITHHSNYIRIMEEARIYLLDKIGWSYDKLEATGIGSPVMSLEANYKKSTSFPDVINVYINVEQRSACKITFGYKFMVGDDVVFTGKSSHCFINEKGMPVIIEKSYPALAKAFAELEQPL